MSEEIIKCPRCGEQIPLTAVITKQIEEKLRKTYDTQVSQLRTEFDERLVKEKSRIEAAARKSLEDSLGSEVAALKAQLTEQST